jgi:hypothetical protein
VPLLPSGLAFIRIFRPDYWDHRDKVIQACEIVGICTLDLWVMNTIMHAFPASGIPERLTDQGKASVGVAGVSRRLPCLDRSR